MTKREIQKTQQEIKRLRKLILRLSKAKDREGDIVGQNDAIMYVGDELLDKLRHLRENCQILVSAVDMYKEMVEIIQENASFKNDRYEASIEETEKEIQSLEEQVDSCCVLLKQQKTEYSKQKRKKVTKKM